MNIEGGTIEVRSGVSVFTGEGFVRLRWGDQAGQLTPAEAMEHAKHVMAAAIAAAHDAAVFAEITEGLGVDQPGAAAFVAALRQRMDRL